jgi:hypothetical protein
VQDAKQQQQWGQLIESRVRRSSYGRLVNDGLAGTSLTSLILRTRFDGKRRGEEGAREDIAPSHIDWQASVGRAEEYIAQ